MSSDGWSVLDKGVVAGPFPADQVQAALADGSIAPDARVWRQGMADWASVGDHFRISRRIPRTGRAGGAEVLLLLLSTLLVWGGTGASLAFMYADLAFGAPPDLVRSAWLAAGLVSLTALPFAAVLWWRLSRRIAARRPELGGLFAVAVILLTLPPLVLSSLELRLTNVVTNGVAAAKTFKGSMHCGDDGVVVFDGAIGLDFPSRLQSCLDRRGGAHTLVLNSRGGLMSEAFRAARIIEARGDVTTIARTECDSACVVVLMSGKQRFADYDMTIGFHQVSPTTDDPDSLITNFVASEQIEQRHFLERHGVPKDVLDKGAAAGQRGLASIPAVDLAASGALTGVLDGDKHLTLDQARLRLDIPLDPRTALPSSKSASGSD